MAEFAETRERNWSTDNLFSRAGWLPYIGAALSMTACYIKTITAALLPLLGGDWNLNPHFQAILMWSLGLLAVIGVYRDKSRHGDRYPLYIASAGLIVIVGTLYLYYNSKVESLGYIILIIGVFLNQNSILKQLNIRTQCQAADLADWNRTLEKRVTEQVAELDRVGQLKRFLSPEIADLIVTQGDKSLLESHRRYIAAMFCDLRGFTTFSESTEPEEVMDILQQYHQELGRLVSKYGGTIDHRSGDGLMVFFNDPLPSEEPIRQAVELAFEAHESIGQLLQKWTRLGHQLGFGIGIAAGYATMGIVGDQNRSDYTAIGNDINLASRLCDHAKDGETLISQKAYIEIEESVEGVKVRGLELKGVNRSQEVYRITRPARE